MMTSVHGKLCKVTARVEIGRATPDDRCDHQVSHNTVKDLGTGLARSKSYNTDVIITLEEIASRAFD